MYLFVLERNHIIWECQDNSATFLYVSKDGLLRVNGGTSPVAQWLTLCTPNAGGLGLIPGQGTRPHMPQPRPGAGKTNK